MDKHKSKFIIFSIAIFGVLLAAMSIAASILILSLGTQFKTLMLSLAVIGILVALFQIYVYIQVLQYKDWARIAAIVLGIIGILTVPLGTFFGMAVIYFFRFDKEVKKVFQ